MNIDGLRKKINETDKQIAALFEERMNAVKLIAEQKDRLGLEVTDKARERELLNKNLAELENPCLREYYINIFETFVSESKRYQTQLLSATLRGKFGLVGYPLKHSLSHIIHRAIVGNLYYYDMFPLSSDALGAFFYERDFTAVNVTAPYKEKVFGLCDILSQDAENTGAVNTVVNRDGVLYGYNTDCFGVRYALRGFDVNGGTAIILGSGGTSKTVRCVLADLGVNKIYTASRTPHEDTVSYGELKNMHADILINTTPVGTYPNSDVSPVNLSEIPLPGAVFDVIYNPDKTALLKQADKLSVPNTNGLEMLAAQAYKAAELFIGKALSDTTIRAATDAVRAYLK